MADQGDDDRHGLAELEAFALTFPEAWIDTPWGDRVVKVRKKIFLFLSPPESERPVITVKLPDTREHALSFPEAQPTGYGLGKHGWVTLPLASVPPEEREILLDFVEESYRAVAPKTLIRQLEADLAAADDDG